MDSTITLSSTISKKALKKAAKMAAREEKLAEKIQLKGGSEEDYTRERLLWITNRKEKGDNPYPHVFKPTITFAEYISRFEGTISTGEHDASKIFSMAGRVFLKRAAGKLFFYTMESNGRQVQFMANYQYTDYAKKQENDNEDDKVARFKTAFREINRGDIIGVTGFVGKSGKGELSLLIQNFQILTPCLKFLPKDVYGLVDIDVRYHKRYLDMIVNRNVRTTLIKRSQIIKFIRNYLDSMDFVEVETPILWPESGGASAKPFITRHNDMDTDVFMRVAPELFLKELVVGGLDRVYEIGKQFRNESIDLTHSPEFTSLEFYMAYADYNDLMLTTEDMLSKLVFKIKESYSATFKTLEEETKTFDFTPPFARIDIMPELTKATGVEFPDDLMTEEARLFLKKTCEDLRIECVPPHTSARLLDKMIGHYLEPRCNNPTFLINHPRIMSPLAKLHRDNPQLTERFELFVGGTELCNAFTELNDPVVQKENFSSQMKDKALGDVEAQSTNDVFVDALKYGLPPTAGFGMGIDRLVMFMTNNCSIREVQTFPIVKSNDRNKTLASVSQISLPSAPPISSPASSLPPAPPAPPAPPSSPASRPISPLQLSSIPLSPRPLSSIPISPTSSFLQEESHLFIYF